MTKISDKILKDWGYHGALYYFANQTVNWSSQREKEIYQKHLQNPATKALLDQLGWTEHNVTYSINSDGFRSDEFDQECFILTAGCSKTFGEGLDRDSMWSKKLCDYFECAHMNLGLNSSSWTNVAMRLTYWIPKLKPKFVAVWSPPLIRQGWLRYDQDGVAMMSSTSKRSLKQSLMNFKVESVMPDKEFEHIEYPFIDMADDANNFYRQSSAVALIEQVCKENSSQLVVLDDETFYHHCYSNKIDLEQYLRSYKLKKFLNLKTIIKSNLGLDMARDLDHDGRKSNHWISQYFIGKINKLID